jgi:two-component system sensor histidine kinase CreC
LQQEDQARFAGAILAQSERLAAMIDRMLTLAAVEHRQRLEHPQRIGIAALLADVEDDSRPRLDARQQRLDIRVDGNPHVIGDEFLLRQALDNLVDNASSFAPAGSVIEADAREHAGRIELRISDRGPGIPDYARDRVFERFYSLPRPDGSHRSSGLGLCFVAQVADLHGGSAELVNREGGGACAVLRVAAARGE